MRKSLIAELAVGATVLTATQSAVAGVQNDDRQSSSRTSIVTGANPMESPSGTHLSENSTIGDLLRHPAFSGFGRLLLPWDARAYDETLQLRQTDSLLPYHSHVQPAVVAAALNRMVDDAAAGKVIFYDIYTKKQQLSDSSLKQTGLFFYRGKPGAPFAIVAPGGGFEYVGSLHEGFPYAAEISRRGYNAFVLKYRVGRGGRLAMADLATALSYVFQHADELGVSREGYSLWGSSAGARMAAAIGSHGSASFGGANLPKPATIVMAYTGHSDMSRNEPPTFVVSGGQDGIAPAAAMARRVAALKSIGTKVEYHNYPALGHGFGLGTGTGAEEWISKAIDFWTSNLD